jgi:formylglycine-generating enzyme required for sulfatase activity
MRGLKFLVNFFCLIGFFPVYSAAEQASSLSKSIRWIKDGSVMVLIPAGDFWMGSDKLPNEKPRHKVFLKDFYIDKFEITNQQYFRFCGGTGRRLPIHLRESGIPSGRENHPVNHINFIDAESYCNWAGKRLPSEDEWEKAARGVDGRVYPWGNNWDQNLSNNRTSPRQDTMAVGSISQGASPYGVIDMAGNVWEWTSSWYQSYPGAEIQFDETGKTRVTRGGAYFYSIDLLRTSYRHALPPDDKSEYNGFRCAAAIDKVKLSAK